MLKRLKIFKMIKMIKIIPHFYNVNGWLVGECASQ